jgi:hypothetical protein
MKTLRLALPLLVLILSASCAAAHPFAIPFRAMPVPAGPATYYYVVTGVDANGLESANSNQATATLVQGMNKGVTLTWTNPAPGAGQSAIVSNNVYRGTTSGGPYTKINSAPVTGGTTYLDPFVAPAAPTGTAATVN